MIWKTVKLEEVCKKITDGSHFSPKTVEEGIPYITVRDISEKGIDFNNCKFISNESFDELKKNGCSPSIGDVLFSKDGTVGKVAEVISEIEFSVLSSLAILTPNRNLINPTFLAYILKSPLFIKQAIQSKTGVAIKRIILKNLKKIQFSLPSLSEQQHIVNKLDSVFSKIDKLKIYQKERQNHNEILISKIQNYLFEDLSLLINNIPLSEVAIFENGDRGKNYPSKKYQIDEGIPFINAGDFSLDGDIKKDKMSYISEEHFNLLNGGKFKLNDILFCLRGSLGKSAFNKKIKKGSIASSLVIIRAKEDIVLPDYIFAFLRSSIVTKYIKETSSGTAQPNLPASVVKNYKIPLFNLDKQYLIASNFWKLRKESIKLQKLAEQQIQLLNSLKRAILRKELQSI